MALSKIPLGSAAGERRRARAEHADEVRRRILEGGARAFARSGFNGTSVPDIAAQAGVSVGLLYRYFESKADLFRALCTSTMEAEMAAVERQLAGIRDPRQRMVAGVTFYLRELAGSAGAGLLLGALAEAPSDAAVRAVMGQRRESIREYVRARLEDGVRAGEVASEVPVADFAEAVTLMLDGAIAAWAVSARELDLEGLVQAVVSLLAAGLRGVPQAPPTPAARRAATRSAKRSAGSSIPTERRSRPGGR